MDVCLTQAMAALATVLYSVYAAPPTASPVAGTPVTVNFNQFQLGSNDIPLSDQLLAPIGGQDTPEQGHVTSAAHALGFIWPAAVLPKSWSSLVSHALQDCVL